MTGAVCRWAWCGLLPEPAGTAAATISACCAGLLLLLLLTTFLRHRTKGFVRLAELLRGAQLVDRDILRGEAVRVPSESQLSEGSFQLLVATLRAHSQLSVASVAAAASSTEKRAAA
jgi:hypothetical protein